MKYYFLLFVTLFQAYHLQAQITTNQDGPWSDPLTWTGGIVPGNSDSVIINHSVNIDANDRIRGVEISPSGVLTNDGFRLRCDGNWANNGSYVDNSGRIQFRRNTNKTISGNTDFNQLQINMTQTINVTGNISVKDWLRLQNGILDVSSGNLVLTATPTKNGRIGRSNSGELIGTFTAERYVDRCNEWSWYAGPFDASLNDFAATTGGNMLYTGFPGSDDPSFAFVNVYRWDEDWSNVGFDGYVIPGNASDIIPRGEGFWYWNSDTVFSSGQTSIPQQWKMTLSGSIDFATPFDFNLQYTNTGDIAFDGWNFLGNPYPGSLNWDVSGWTSNDLDGALYMYNTCGQSYSSYVGGVGTNGGRKWIPSFQGFYVKAVAGAPALQVTSDCLRQNDIDLKTTNLEENILRIFLGNDEIVIRQNDHAASDFNVGMDAQKFIAEYARLYTENYGLNTLYSINTVNDSSAQIPLYVKGSGVLEFSDMQTWESDYNLTLEDLSDGQMYPIVQGFQFPFTENDSLNFVNRFVIHLFGGSSLGVEDLENNGLQVLYDKNDFIIKSDYMNRPVQVEMVNLMGQVVYSEKIVITKEGFRMRRPNQVMILRLINNEINKSIKVF